MKERTTLLTTTDANLNHYLDDLVTPHFVYLGIDCNPDRRAEPYRAWLRLGINNEELSLIRDHLQQERVLGDVKFQAMLERTPGRGKVARPAKS